MVSLGGGRRCKDGTGEAVPSEHHNSGVSLVGVTIEVRLFDDSVKS